MTASSTTAPGAGTGRTGAPTSTPGCSTPAWYYLALDTAAELAGLSGNSGDVAGYQSLRTSVRNNFDRVLWKSASNEYRSPGYTGDTDDRGHGLAVVAGLAAPANHAAITKVLRDHQNADPYLEFYVLEALYLMGRADVAEARMRSRYAGQVADSGYTLWEVWTKGGGNTDNHTWNGGPLYVLSAYAAGLRPSQPGWTQYDVVPQSGGFSEIDTVTPTVKGDITFALARSGTTVTLTLASPSGTTARVGVPTYGGAQPVIRANGTTVFSGGSSTGSVSGLAYDGKDSAHVYFTAAYRALCGASSVRPHWMRKVRSGRRVEHVSLGHVDL
ncbi:alpha-L-rhamnosidase C-terminal domain-containing protein [Streptomyces sp. ME08-AFT2]|uniref:alpha-L-rhamnosidase C-terminal domain-containing protein n=1 Tax=Streptomyces sp. ME08-AFT2 TaxID=3028683 RepID=UPI0029BB7FC7|nr:alpha-L-rhamnosidase C-terminal domain-containing protein [Streptomyces sp. ME08-AFT2]MDX3313337.1 alpha-L-rhamnosidase C-terminal domain-containing protein [Streptomyces sp. ME08-AFT2]